MLIVIYTFGNTDFAVRINVKYLVVIIWSECKSPRPWHFVQGFLSKLYTLCLDKKWTPK